MGTATAIDHPIIFFDGVCNLCNSSVHFVIDRDNGYFRFASLQSDFAQETLKALGYDPAALESIVLLDGTTLKKKSSAALHVASHLKGGWKGLGVFRIVPPFIMDFIYDIIAKNRYKWFGQQETCRMPSPELNERFLDS